MSNVLLSDIKEACPLKKLQQKAMKRELVQSRPMPGIGLDDDAPIPRVNFLYNITFSN
jgi:hypothetical protein